MTGNEIRAKYLKFMEDRGHAIVPSSGLIPENDPTTLFTGSGMQPMVPYLLGEKHPKGTRIADSQKSFRADDIEEVGDNRHTTFFEMLGNWSFGDYFKKEQIEWMFEFLTVEIGLDTQKLYISAFGGDEKNNLPKDDEAPLVWQALFKTVGIDAQVAYIGSEEDGYKRGMKDGERIFYYEAKKNWWSRAGVPQNMPIGEPGGPDSEMFYDFFPNSTFSGGHAHEGDDVKWGTFCHPNCDCGRFLEIGNNVFMQYVKTGENEYTELKSKNIDFGGGLERIVAAHNNNPDVFKTDLLWNVVEQIQEASGKKYDDNLVAFRVITDHIRGAVFMIGDSIFPSNTDQGYFVRRLLRRAVRYADVLGIKEGELKNLALSVIATYKEHYINLEDQKQSIIDTIAQEETQFRKTLEHGLKQFNKVSVKILATTHVDEVTGQKVLNKETNVEKYVSGKSAFELFTTYGFPIELTEEIAKERGMYIDIATFKTLMEEHRALSRAGAEQKFKGGLADHSEKVVQYHTATHLMLAGLRKELGDNVHQAGSNITGERLRFDFTFSEKVQDETLRKVEEFVNNALKNGGEVTTKMMLKNDAEADPTIEASFWDRYPDEVKVYSMTSPEGTLYSRELCGGPHVQNFSEIQGAFKIIKEESSSQGVRRIKAVLE